QSWTWHSRWPCERAGVERSSDSEGPSCRRDTDPRRPSSDRMKRLVPLHDVVASAPHCEDALEAQERRPAMEYGAIDLHKKESHIRIVTMTGEIIDQRIATTRERFTHVFWGRPRMRILVEASTESEWVALHLEQLGHEVIVADPNYGLMYGNRGRRGKTDHRDVVTLAEACQHGTYRRAHRRSARQHEVQC